MGYLGTRFPGNLYLQRIPLFHKNVHKICRNIVHLRRNGSVKQFNIMNTSGELAPFKRVLLLGESLFLRQNI